MDYKAETSKKQKNKQGYVEAGKFKKKKGEIIMIYFRPLNVRKFLKK